MGSYVVLARKWRPSQFSDIVGQGHIVRTLMNAIRSERIHQAYLFTGSRGIGKTSIARIFAKVIRCENGKDDATWLRSCDECSSCREIAAGNSVDVIEIDGASNNGVDAIREIRENAKYLPSNGKRKIYIIDEVHMLTTAAFNALLKTLEEPPPHVIFIFATTEPHKIPPTILSRCQRFDYRRVTVAQIQARLAQVSESEKIQAEPAAFALIARAAEGSMRDALSLLDQVIAFSGNKITAQSVRESIGLIEGQALLAILSGIFGRKPKDALAVVEQAYGAGHDLRVLTRSLLELLHGAVLFKVGATQSAILELSEDESSELQAIAEQRSLEEIELIFQVLHHGLEWIARSPQPKVVLDVLLVKCAMAEMLVPAQAASAGGSNPSPAPASKAEIPAAKPAATPVRSTAAEATAAPVSKTEAPTEIELKLPTPNFKPTWEGLIDFVRKGRPLLASALEHGFCAAFPTESEHRLIIQFSPNDAYSKEQVNSRAYIEQFGNLTKEYFGKTIGIKVEMKELSDQIESLAAKREREFKERTDAAKAAVRNHPIIQEARQLFGAELGSIDVNNDFEGNSGESNAATL